MVDNLSLTFSVTRDFLGTIETIDLKENGRHIDVTDENKNEYLMLQLRYRMFESVSDQLGQMLRGFYEVIPREIVSVFDYQELELLMCGVPEIDVQDWRRQTVYVDMEDDSFLAEWFWDIVESFSQENRARLLQFTTGSARVPTRGFKALQRNDGVLMKFTIQAISREFSAYPRAHTCFNRLDLPRYGSKEELRASLTLVINMEISGFSME